MDLGFLKSRQKNTNIPFSNFDFTHDNGYTSKLGEMLVTQCTKVLPNDKIKHRINEETLLQPLENPSFTKFKHVHKSFYYPNTVLWKYWDNFLTNKPDDLWTNSDITSFINERQPYSIPKCYFKDLLPYMAIAGGFASDMLLGMYLPQLPYILQTLKSSGYSFQSSDFELYYLQFWPPYCPLEFTGSDFNGLESYVHAIADGYSFKRPYSSLFHNTHDSEYGECCFYDDQGTLVQPQNFLQLPNYKAISQFIQHLTADISGSSLTSNVKQQLLSYINGNYFYNNLRFFVRFKIVSQPVNKVGFTHLYAQGNTTADAPYDKCDFKNLICVDSANTLIGAPFVTTDPRFFNIKNRHNNVDYDYFLLPLPSALEATSFGFTPLAFFFYNCRNIAKHLDMMGINIPSDFINFTQQDLFEPINLLPYFAYNRFYHEEIADKQRQVNCPNWSAANGLVCTYENDEQKAVSSLEKYQEIGWTLHFEDIPYNKQFNLQDIKITTYNPFSAAMLFMGFDINLLCTNQGYSNLQELTLSYAKSPCVVSFMQPVFQCYNGLLHLQYANFAPDYFNQSVMDPLAGAQDIQIPSTITQLQEKSKLQELLNQTAWTRNIKEFLQSQFDAFSKYTTIDDPVITGSCDVDVNISQVLQTSESSQDSALGSRAGVGSAYGNGWLCDNEFHEFGYYMTISYFVMNSIYINRLDKSLIAEDNYLELPFPQLANLGNEAIKAYEVKFGQSENYVNNTLTPLSIAPYIHGFAQLITDPDDPNALGTLPVTPLRIPKSSGSTNNAPVPLVENATYDGSNINFGYIPRFSSYKFKFDQVHGEFLTTLKNWVATRELQIMPLQTYTFISYECQAQLSNLMKNFVDKDQLIADSFLTNSVNIMSVRRCLPFIVNPSM